MTNERSIPTGRFLRLAGLSKLALQNGAALITSRSGEAAAERAAAVLGELRGLAAKLGQMASYVDGFMPEAHSEAYTRALSALQSNAPASPFSEVQRTLEVELGAPLAKAFASFEQEPFASASMGQVHRAQLPDGRAVAVKVQHPGVAASLEADLGNVGAMSRMVSVLAPRAVNVDEVVAEVSARFREELDYRHEAGWMRSFAALLADEPLLEVPTVIDGHSSARVLTTALVRAHGFGVLCEADTQVKKRAAELLWRAVFKPIVHGGAFNADPHPGNFLFHPDGRITLLDFGCVQRLSHAYVRHLPALHGAALEHDRGAFGLAARAALGTVPGRYETALVEYLWQVYTPLRAPRYRVGRDYVATLVSGTSELKRAMLTPGAHATPLPAGFALLNRLQFGFWSLLARLDVEADYGTVHRALLAARPAEPTLLAPRPADVGAQALA